MNKLDFLAEAMNFNEALNSLYNDAFTILQPIINEKHKFKVEYNGSERVEISCVLDTIVFGVMINSTKDMPSGKEFMYYNTWITIEMVDIGNSNKKTCICDGNIEYHFWEFIKDKINWAEFPNFQKPTFSKSK